MATFSLSLDTGAIPLSKITGAFRVKYDDPIHNPPGETDAALTKRILKEFIANVVFETDFKTAQSGLNVTKIILT